MTAYYWEFGKWGHTRSDWNRQTSLYIIDINSILKIGITYDWNKRLKIYEKEYSTRDIHLLKKDIYSRRWQAEIIEQIVCSRLGKWMIRGKEEYFKGLTIQSFLKCYYETRNFFTSDWQTHNYTDYYKLWKDDRLNLYNRLKAMYFGDFQPA